MKQTPDPWHEFLANYGVEHEDDWPTVCIIHRRFVPCRSQTYDCIYSNDPDDVAAVRRYQQGQRD